MKSISNRWKTFWDDYEKPLERREPVVCLDEKPVTLHADIRPPSPCGPDEGKTGQRIQTLRHGQCLLRRGAESGTAFHLPTPNRSSPQFADYRLDIVITIPKPNDSFSDG